MKKIKKVLATVLALTMGTSALALASCNPEVADDDQTLEIFIENYGYGYNWLNSQIELFKQQSWVKEKYPNLNIPEIAYNSEDSFAATKITSGKSSNTADLLFSVASPAPYYAKRDNTGALYFEDLTQLYNTKVPDAVPEAEQRTLKDKMIDELAKVQYIETFEGPKTYYSVPWVDGWMGILYNKTLVDQYLGEDYQLPRTTKEFLQMTTDIKANNTKSGSGKLATPFVTSSKVSYWTEIFVTWWAQYEGVSGYENYWNGLNEFNERSSEIFSQKGRLRALETLESLIGVTANNNHEEVNTLEFTSAQAKFLLGEGVMMPNGDWFENEMRETAEENPYDYDITFMRVPVISTIVEKLEYRNGTDYMSDETLATLVDAIDQGKTYDEAKTLVTGLTQNDYNKLTEARKVIYKNKGHEAFVPAYATAKELAKDFLLFLATDVACENFMKVTHGCGVPYEYNVKTANETLYNSFPMMQKARIEIMNDAIPLKPLNAFRLVNYGGLSYFVKTPLLDVAFTAKNADDRKTAKQIFDEDVKFFTESGGANWTFLLNKAGL